MVIKHATPRRKKKEKPYPTNTTGSIAKNEGYYNPNGGSVIRIFIRLFIIIIIKLKALCVW